MDVFFVISGYLITTIILGDIAAGKFTISGFYERRVAKKDLPGVDGCDPGVCADCLFLDAPEPIGGIFSKTAGRCFDLFFEYIVLASNRIL